MAKAVSHQMTTMETGESKIPTWSALGRLGRNRVVSLTIFVPFIGWLILFNHQVVELLRLSDAFFSLGAGDAADASRRFTVTRLHFTYFGLLIVASASALFALYCPAIIKSAGTRNDYISAERKLMTAARRHTLISDVCKDYLWHHHGPQNYPLDPSKNRWGGFVTYTYKLVQRFETTLTQIYRIINQSVFGESGEPGRYISATDNVIVEDFAEMLATQGRVERGYWSAVDDVLHEFDRDLLTFEYDVPDNSNPKMRLTIFVLYAVGLVALAIPTAETCFHIIARI